MNTPILDGIVKAADILNIDPHVRGVRGKSLGGSVGIGAGAGALLGSIAGPPGMVVGGGLGSLIALLSHGHGSLIRPRGKDLKKLSKK